MNKVISSDDDIKVDIIDTKNDTKDDIIQNNTIKYVNMNSASNDSKWSRADENTVNKYKLKSIGYKVLYNDTYFRYSIYYNLIKIPLWIITILSNIINIIFAVIIQGNMLPGKEGILVITMTTLSAIATGLTYFYDSSDYKNMADGSREAGIAFSEFADELTTLLTYPRKIRANPYEVINTIQSDYKKLLKMYKKFPIPASVYHNSAKNPDNKHIIIDIFDNTDADQFNVHDGLLEKNIITDKFIDSLRSIRNNVPASLSTERKHFNMSNPISTDRKHLITPDIDNPKSMNIDLSKTIIK